MAGGHGGGEDLAHAGGVDEDLVAHAVRHHLGVTGDDVHAGGLRGSGHVGHHAVEDGELQTFLDDAGAAQVAGPGAQHGHIVDRAVHSQGADAAPGEKEGRDGVGVRAHGQRALDVQQGGVVHAVQQGVGEMAHEALGDEPLRGASAAACIQQNAIVHDDPGSLGVTAGRRCGAGRKKRGRCPFPVCPEAGCCGCPCRAQDVRGMGNRRDPAPKPYT